MDADRLIQIAAELKTLEQRREGLLAEIGRIGGLASGAPHRGRPQGSKNQASAGVRRGPGRPPGSLNQAKPVLAPARGGKRRSGVTAKIVEFMKSGGGAYTAGDILEGLKLPKSKGLATTIGTTLVRLAKEGRANKDANRGYRAASPAYRSKSFGKLSRVDAADPARLPLQVVDQACRLAEPSA